MVSTQVGKRTQYKNRNEWKKTIRKGKITRMRAVREGEREREREREREL